MIRPRPPLRTRDPEHFHIGSALEALRHADAGAGKRARCTGSVHPTGRQAGVAGGRAGNRPEEGTCGWIGTGREDVHARQGAISPLNGGIGHVRGTTPPKDAVALTLGVGRDTDSCLPQEQGSDPTAKIGPKSILHSSAGRALANAQCRSNIPYHAHTHLLMRGWWSSAGPLQSLGNGSLTWQGTKANTLHTP